MTGQEMIDTINEHDLKNCELKMKCHIESFVDEDEYEKESISEDN